MKLSVKQIEPRLVQHVREVAIGKGSAQHPVYDVTEHVGTGKATCRGCGEKIKEGEPALLFWHARYEPGHELDFIRDRSIIHASGCTEGPLIKCPCGEEVAQEAWSQHVKKHDRPWQLRKPASIIRLCMFHKLEHCGQCEEDRELELPKFREEILKLLQITASANDDEIMEYFDDPRGYVEDPDPKFGSPYPQKSTRDIAQEVTDRIIASLEKGTVPWKQPWAAASGSLPTSIHGRPYRGINLLLLSLAQQDKNYPHPLWITYDQAKKMGGSVRKGEKSTLVTFRKKIQVPDRDATPVPGEPAKKKTIPLLRHYNVFNIAQTDGVILPPRIQKIIDRPAPEPVEVLPSVTSILQGYRGGPPISHIDMAVGAPNYRPSEDRITLPHPHQFASPEAYASTVFHEIVHSTGHSSRLDRFALTGEPQHFGSERYAQEELVAELGNAMLLGHSGIQAPHEEEQNAAYIQSWLKALRGDKNFVIQAAGKAQKAVDHILGVNPEEFKDEEEGGVEGEEKTASKWRHTEDDGFEMWETTEKHNEYAIVEAGDKYDLYTLVGSFDSPDQAKAAAEGTKTAQDGGGGGDGGGGASGGDGGGTSGGDGSGGDASGDSSFSGGGSNADGDSDGDDDGDFSDGDEDPRPPTGGHDNCPRCGDHLNPIYLVGGRVYTCMNCGFTSRKKRKRESSWFDRIPQPESSSTTSEEIPILPINPIISPVLMETPAEQTDNKTNAGKLFSMSFRARFCSLCGKQIGSSEAGSYTGICEADRERLGIVLHEYGSEDSRSGHYG